MQDDATLHQVSLRKRKVFFVNKGALQLAIREWRREITSPIAAAIFGGVIIILLLMSPFDVGAQLSIRLQLIYWTAVVLTTYSAGAIINGYLRAQHGAAWSIGRLCATNTVLTGIAVTVIVVAINAVTFQYVPAAADMPMYFGSIFAVAAIVSFIFFFANGGTTDATPRMPAILDRLPFDKRGALLCLSVEDHYVRIETTNGSEMVLMRLRDAMRETDPTAGFQVHRSHWVARDAIQSARRDADRAILTLHNGRDVPASRRYVPVLKKAGFLP